jgi:hypothetical protein
MSQPSYRNNMSSDQGDSVFLTAMLGVATVFILAAVVALSYYLKTYYGVYLWNF